MNQEQFKNTVFIHKDKLFRFAKRILVDDDEAFDAVQNVMMRYGGILYAERKK